MFVQLSVSRFEERPSIEAPESQIYACNRTSMLTSELISFDLEVFDWSDRWNACLELVIQNLESKGIFTDFLKNIFNQTTYILWILIRRKLMTETSNGKSTSFLQRYLRSLNDYWIGYIENQSDKKLPVSCFEFGSNPSLFSD